MNKEILKFCMEKGVLLDSELLNLFSESDIESVKLIVERVKTFTNQTILTKSFLEKNRESVNKFFVDLSEEKQKKLETLKLKLGLSIEISRECVAPEESFVKNSFGTNVSTSKNIQELNRKIEVSDFVNYFRARVNKMKMFLQQHNQLENLVSIDKIWGNKKGISIIGIVYSKIVTKNKNIILEVEDMTGKIKVLINQTKPELYKSAEEILLDSVLAFKGSGNREIFFANEIVFPDIGISERKKSPIEEYALFIGDLHFGSKNFLKKGFLRFLDYLNGKLPNTSEISKINYLFIVGDVVTGVGNYPDQERDLEITGLEEQFLGLAELLSKVPKHIKIIISPGNHDGVRLMEPQPNLDKKYSWALWELENVIFTENPCTVNIGAKNNFKGFDVLTYHGFSYIYYAGNVPDLIRKKAMNHPEEIMKYLLKNRHLAPTHGSTQYYPSEEDGLLISNIPDIFVSAHTHKCGVSNYNNILIISTSCWEAMTPYQEKFGNEPDHCKVPLLNLKTGAVKILDFKDEN